MQLNMSLLPVYKPLQTKSKCVHTHKVEPRKHSPGWLHPSLYSTYIVQVKQSVILKFSSKSCSGGNFIISLGPLSSSSERKKTVIGNKILTKNPCL